MVNPPTPSTTLMLSIRNYYDAGNFYLVTARWLSSLALFDRLGIYEAAATISGFAAIPLTRSPIPEIGMSDRHLREVLGDEATNHSHAQAKT